MGLVRLRRTLSGRTAAFATAPNTSAAGSDDVRERGERRVLDVCVSSSARGVGDAGLSGRGVDGLKGTSESADRGVASFATVCVPFTAADPSFTVSEAAFSLAAELTEAASDAPTGGGSGDWDVVGSRGGLFQSTARLIFIGPDCFCGLLRSGRDCSRAGEGARGLDPPKPGFEGWDWPNMPGTTFLTTTTGCEPGDEALGCSSSRFLFNDLAAEVSAAVEPVEEWPVASGAGVGVTYFELLSEVTVRTSLIGRADDVPAVVLVCVRTPSARRIVTGCLDSFGTGVAAALGLAYGLVPILGILLPAVGCFKLDTCLAGLEAGELPTAMGFSTDTLGASSSSSSGIDAGGRLELATIGKGSGSRAVSARVLLRDDVPGLESMREGCHVEEPSFPAVGVGTTGLVGSAERLRSRLWSIGLGSTELPRPGSAEFSRGAARGRMGVLPLAGELDDGAGCACAIGTRLAGLLCGSFSIGRLKTGDPRRPKFGAVCLASSGFVAVCFWGENVPSIMACLRGTRRAGERGGSGSLDGDEARLSRGSGRRTLNVVAF